MLEDDDDGDEIVNRKVTKSKAINSIYFYNYTYICNVYLISRSYTLPLNIVIKSFTSNQKLSN